jgi:hypothetical protein
LANDNRSVKDGCGGGEPIQSFAAVARLFWFGLAWRHGPLIMSFSQVIVYLYDPSLFTHALS